jgi:hypothetical protein
VLGGGGGAGGGGGRPPNGVKVRGGKGKGKVVVFLPPSPPKPWRDH